MGRIARRYLVAENTVNHCSWRSHNHEFVFETDEEKAKFLSLLNTNKCRHGILILSYALMGTHPHVVCVATRGQEAFSAFWRVVNHAYARWYNRRHGRRGQVVMERLSSPQIQDERHLLTAMRYGDLNPVRAGLVRRAQDWRWSSHRHYAFGDPDELVDDAPAFLNLGKNAVERRRIYRGLFTPGIAAAFAIRRADLVSVPFIGDPSWIEAKLGAIPGTSPPTGARRDITRGAGGNAASRA